MKSLLIILKISALVSDYDGTLCPTASISSKDNCIPQDLNTILLDISKRIPVCILSSKDYQFLSTHVNFAKIISCIMGIETISYLDNDMKNRFEGNQDIIIKNEKSDNTILFNSHNNTRRYFLKNKKKILYNSTILENLARDISSRFEDIKIYKKYTFTENILAGISFDYRHLLKWNNYKLHIEPKIQNRINEHIKLNQSPGYELGIEMYESHPFIDVYAIKISKGEALEFIREILNFEDQKILYLGDSENDNTAFKQADLSVSIISDNRINTKLDSHYSLEFNELTNFLTNLYKEDFHFSNMFNRN